MNASISVIIPAYNAEMFIDEAITSVLDQTTEPHEILVIDDGSTDNTAELARRYGGPVRVLSTENRGVAAARNYALQQAAADYVAFLDSDDVWEPTKLQRQCAAISPDRKLIYTDTISFGSPEMAGVRMSSGRTLPSGNIFEALVKTNFVATSSVFTERALALAAGGFSTEFRVGEDWALWLQLARVTEATYVDAPLVRYRIRPGSLSNNLEERVACETAIIHRAVQWLESKSPAERKAIIRQSVAGAQAYAALLAYSEGAVSLSRDLSFRAFRTNPTISAAKLCLKTLLGPKWTQFLRSIVTH